MKDGIWENGDKVTYASTWSTSKLKTATVFGQLDNVVAMMDDEDEEVISRYCNLVAAAPTPKLETGKYYTYKDYGSTYYCVGYDPEGNEVVTQKLNGGDDWSSFTVSSSTREHFHEIEED